MRTVDWVFLAGLLLLVLWLVLMTVVLDRRHEVFERTNEHVARLIANGKEKDEVSFSCWLDTSGEEELWFWTIRRFSNSYGTVGPLLEGEAESAEQAWEDATWEYIRYQYAFGAFPVQSQTSVQASRKIRP